MGRKCWLQKSLLGLNDLFSIEKKDSRLRPSKQLAATRRVQTVADISCADVVETRCSMFDVDKLACLRTSCAHGPFATLASLQHLRMPRHQCCVLRAPLVSRRPL